MRFCAILVLVLLLACNNKNQEKEKPVNLTEEKLALMKADAAFSDMSVKKGMKAAFMEYIDSNGVMLRPGYTPLVGAGAIDYLLQSNDTGFTLSWKPQTAFVSASADMGYTYGIFALAPNKSDSITFGTYVSIWKKQKDGKWKFVFDSGNEGLSENFNHPQP